MDMGRFVRTQWGRSAILVTATILCAQGAVALAIPVNASPFGIAVNIVTNRVYVLQDSEFLGIISGERSRFTNEIPVDRLPRRVAVDELLNYIYVTHDCCPGMVSIIDGRTQSLITKTILPVGSARAIVVNSPTKKVYLSVAADDSVVVTNAKIGAIRKSIPLGDTPSSLAANSVTNRIYVVHPDGDSFSVIDGSIDEVVGTFPSGLDIPGLIAANSATNRVYIVNSVGSLISVIDGSTNGVIDQVSIPRARGTVGGIAVDPVANRVFVVDSGHDRFWTVDGFTDTVKGRSFVGALPSDIAVNPATGRVYISNRDQSNVSVVYESELLKNSSFDSPSRRGMVPPNWTVQNLGDSDSLVGYKPFPTGPVFDGKYSFRIVGGPVPKELTQKVRLEGTAGTVINLEGFSKADSPSPTGTYKIKAKVFYTDGSSEDFALHFARSTHDWQRKVGALTAARDFDKIIVTVMYDSPTGTVWFDGLHLWLGAGSGN